MSKTEEALPPLPEPYMRESIATASNTRSVRHGYEQGGYVRWPDMFTADQMCDYASAALAQRQQVPPLSDRCDWCCGTGRFADHACRFCGGKAKGSVFTSQQQQSAQPEQQPVAWRYRYSTKGRWNYADGPANDPAVIEEPLYATQPRAVEPLTQRQLAMLKFLYGSGLISGVGFGCKPDGVTAPYWWRHELAEAFPVLRGIGKHDVSTADLARFRAACRAEALEEAAPVLSRAAEMLTAYAELVKATGKYAEMHYVPEIEYHAAAIRELK